MNYGSIRYIIGWILKVEAALMTLPMIVSVVYREKTGVYFVMAALLCLGAGVLLSMKKPEKTTYYAKEGYISVALGWIVMSIMGCLPFVFSGEIPFFFDALFEIISVYDNGRQHPDGCGGPVKVYAFLAELFPLGWGHGRSRFHPCHSAAGRRRAQSAAYESGVTGAVGFKTGAETAGNRDDAV